MNQKGFINIILIVVVIILAGAGTYFILNRKNTPPHPAETLTPAPTATTTSTPPSKSPTDVFLPKINELITRGIGQIVECKKGNVKYFYWGFGTALPAAIMRKEGNQPWEARPGIPNRTAGSPIKEAKVNSLGVNPENCDELYVVTEWAEAYKSKNGGKAWEEIKLAGISPRGISWGLVAINPKNSLHIIIGTAFPIHSELTRYRIYQSRDGGESFYPVELEREFTQPPTSLELANLLF